MHLQPLPALTDNYIWTLADDQGRAVVVDPGDCEPVLRAAVQGLTPVAVLLTHHHADHIQGAAELLRRWPNLPVYAPVEARIELPCQRVAGGDRVTVLDWTFEVLEIPGHTRSHIGYVGHEHLFCGDTLFSLGCGRMFEGTPAQMLASLDKLAALPGRTRVCCGHEYTLANAAFARMVDPGNPALCRRHEEAIAMRNDGQPTLPSTLADEFAANPFLRVGDTTIRAAVAGHMGASPGDRVETFAALRRWKDGFPA